MQQVPLNGGRRVARQPASKLESQSPQRPPFSPHLHPPYPASLRPRVPKLSVTVVAKNEAADLGSALASVAWADEIVVVDSHSTDDTVAIARQYTERVVVHDWLGHIEQKNYAASLASHDWILSLDADERVTPALADEIRATLRLTPATPRSASRG